MELVSMYQGDPTCSGFPMTGATNWDQLEASLTQSGASGTSRRPTDDQRMVLILPVVAWFNGEDRFRVLTQGASFQFGGL